MTGHQRGDGVALPDVDLPVDLDEVRRVLRRYGAVFALVFGSRALGTARPDSDTDIEFWAPSMVTDWSLWAEFPDSIDILDLNRAPDYLTGRVALHGLVILDDDPARRIRWQADTRKRYLDEAWRRRQFRRDFVAAHA
jgi:hypothetical protein